jgi:hypothetical protein
MKEARDSGATPYRAQTFTRGPHRAAAAAMRETGPAEPTADATVGPLDQVATGRSASTSSDGKYPRVHPGTGASPVDLAAAKGRRGRRVRSGGVVTAERTR